MARFVSEPPCHTVCVSLPLLNVVSVECTMFEVACINLQIAKQMC